MDYFNKMTSALNVRTTNRKLKVNRKFGKQLSSRERWILKEAAICQRGRLSAYLSMITSFCDTKSNVSLEGAKEKKWYHQRKKTTPSFPSQGVNKLNCLFWKLLKGLIVWAFLASVGYVYDFRLKTILNRVWKHTPLLFSNANSITSSCQFKSFSLENL